MFLGNLFCDISHIPLNLTDNRIACPSLLQFNYQNHLLVFANRQYVYWTCICGKLLPEVFFLLVNIVFSPKWCLGPVSNQEIFQVLLQGEYNWIFYRLISADEQEITDPD